MDVRDAVAVTGFEGERFSVVGQQVAVVAGSGNDLAAVTQGEGVLDVASGRIPAELSEGVAVGEAPAQGWHLAGSHLAGMVGAVAPDFLVRRALDPVDAAFACTAMAKRA